MAKVELAPGDAVISELPSSTQGRRYPDFLCMGAQKAGTTWLDSNLRKLPGIWLPPVKELHYFSEMHITEDREWASDHRRTQAIQVLRDYLKDVDEQSWNYRFIARTADIASGVPSDEWYGNIFSMAAPTQICGEITPAYSVLPRAGIEHVKRLMPRLKIIMFLRDPIERSWSHLRMLVAQRGRSDLASLIRKAASTRIAGRSNYPQILDLWSQHFNEDRFFIAFMDDIVSFPDRVLGNICEFLQIEYEQNRSADLNAAVHVGKEISIPPELYEFLKDQMRPIYIELKARYPEIAGKWAARHYGNDHLTP